MNELKKLPARVSTVRGASPFFVTDRAVLESATLGEPFVLYWPDTTFLTHYEKAEAGELLRYFRKSICFPVYAADSVLGTINISEDENGVRSPGTRFVGGGVAREADEFRRSATVTGSVPIVVEN